MRRKKVFSLVLATIITTVLAAGCGTSPATDTTYGTANASTSSNKMVEIAVDRATFNQASSDSTEVEAIQNAINKYIGPKINVQIKLSDISSGEYADRTNLSLANGEANLFWTANWEGAVSTDNLYSQNAVYDISDLLPGTDLYNSMPEEVWNSSKYNGNDYFIPCYKESAEGYDLVYPTTKAKKYNWDMSSIKELKDIEPMLADMKADGVKYPLLMQKMPFFSKYYIDKYDFSMANTMIVIDLSKNEVVNCIQTKDYKDFVTLISDWATKGYISDEEVTKTIPDTAIMTTDWGFAAWVDVPNNDDATTTYGQDCDVVHMTKDWTNSTSTLGSCYAISSSCTEEQAKACIDFLGLLYTDSTLANLYTYGIEGTDYDMSSDGFVVKKGELYNHSAWESGSVKSIALEKGSPSNTVELYENFNTKSVASPASGFRPDYSSVEAQWSACTSIYDQYGYALEEGAYTPEDVESVIAKYQTALDNAGFQDVLTEIQSQYKEWKASNN